MVTMDTRSEERKCVLGQSAKTIKHSHYAIMRRMEMQIDAKRY